MKTLVVTQARTGARRLPNKVLKKIKGLSILEIHLKRILKCKEIDENKPFLRWLKQEKLIYTWKDTKEKIFKLSNKVESLIKKGDRCLILSENRPYWLIADIAIMNAGGVSVPIFTTYSSNDYKSYIILYCNIFN